MSKFLSLIRTIRHSILVFKTWNPNFKYTAHNIFQRVKCIRTTWNWIAFTNRAVNMHCIYVCYSNDKNVSTTPGDIFIQRLKVGVSLKKKKGNFSSAHIMTSHDRLTRSASVWNICLKLLTPLLIHIVNVTQNKEWERISVIKKQLQFVSSYKCPERRKLDEICSVYTETCSKTEIWQHIWLWFGSC